MIKTILVPVTGLPSDAAALETAYLAARLFDSHLDGLHVRPAWAQVAATTITEDVAGVVADEFFAAFEHETKLLAWRAHRHFTAFCRDHVLVLADAPSAESRISAALKETEGDPERTVISHARFHDLVVLGRGNASAAYRIDPGAVLVAAGRPVLLAPSQTPENLAPTIAIAWKETAEAARAMTAAMPFLTKAEKIILVAADEGEGGARTAASAERAADYLRWHGFVAETRLVAAGGRPASEAVLEAAQESGANLLVMGGYGHARLREFIFGGFTQDVLRDCRLPVLLFH
jgi:nucleotide-binding universal stress UspA family protein